jgi:hypothetical protein
MGDTKGGPFDIEDEIAQEMLRQRNPHGRPNKDVVVPWVNGMRVTRQPKPMWIIDFGVNMEEKDAALYEAPFEYVRKHVRPERSKNSREAYAEHWWLHVEPRPGMRKALAGLERFICTVRHAKHRIFFWVPRGTLPDSALIAFARDDDYTFGVLQSRVHSVWSLAKGTQVREKESGFRYTPTSTFETFPFPAPETAQRMGIAAWAQRLNELRETRLRGKKDGASGDVTLTSLYTANPSWLQRAHTDLDRAVIAAYGWKADISDDEMLAKLLGLAIERANAAANARGGSADATVALVEVDRAARKPARAASTTTPITERRRNRKG